MGSARASPPPSQPLRPLGHTRGCWEQERREASSDPGHFPPAPLWFLQVRQARLRLTPPTDKERGTDRVGTCPRPLGSGSECLQSPRDHLLPSPAISPPLPSPKGPNTLVAPSVLKEIHLELLNTRGSREHP